MFRAVVAVIADDAEHEVCDVAFGRLSETRRRIKNSCHLNCCRNGDDTFNLNHNHNNMILHPIRVLPSWVSESVMLVDTREHIAYSILSQNVAFDVDGGCCRRRITDRIIMRICNIFTSLLCCITFYITHIISFTYSFWFLFTFAPRHSIRLQYELVQQFCLSSFLLASFRCRAFAFGVSACFWFSKSHIIRKTYIMLTTTTGNRKIHDWSIESHTRTTTSTHNIAIVWQHCLSTFSVRLFWSYWISFLFI